MSARAAWRWCAAAGAVAFVCSWLFGRIPGLVACGTTGGLGPIIAFELSRSPTEVAALFGADPCRATLVGAQRSALLLDGLGFIPGYTAFTAMAACAVTLRWRWPLVGLLLVAGLCDEIEGGLLYAILRDLPGTPRLLAGLFWVVRTKFALLAFGTMAIGAMLVDARRVVPGIPGLAVVTGGAMALYGVPAVMMRGFAIGWFALLAAALIASCAPSLFSPARAAPPRPRARPTP